MSFTVAVLTFQPCIAHKKTTPRNSFYIFKATGKFTVFLRHAALFLFYFPQNTVYVIILSFSVHILLVIFIIHVPKFKYQPGHLKLKANLCVAFTKQLAVTSVSLHYLTYSKKKVY